MSMLISCSFWMVWNLLLLVSPDKVIKLLKEYYASVVTLVT